MKYIGREYIVTESPYFKGVAIIRIVSYWRDLDWYIAQVINPKDLPISGLMLAGDYVRELELVA